eukprot:TRINITY_DN20271_c0_g1_i2.p1 TRINITY_DN20271_c0_g1~~TRINITY_DN20271_c0_g1_i2.p1  ORF type:complete len:193 (+),score=6.99 TRINITY_DN20271_c0_g1_i2:59-580(+)
MAQLFVLVAFIFLCCMGPGRASARLNKYAKACAKWMVPFSREIMRINYSFYETKLAKQRSCSSFQTRIIDGTLHHESGATPRIFVANLSGCTFYSNYGKGCVSLDSVEWLKRRLPMPVDMEHFLVADENWNEFNVHMGELKDVSQKSEQRKQRREGGVYLEHQMIDLTSICWW